MTLEWSERYVSGYPEIDAQHCHLFELINHINQINTIEELKPLLMLLYQHTREHFQQEEELMRCAGFSGLDDHINGHNYLLERLNAFSIEIGHGHFNKADLVKLMTDWAMNHIVRNDIPALAFITKIKIDPLANAVPSAPAAKVNALHRQPFRGIPTRVPL